MSYFSYDKEQLNGKVVLALGNFDGLHLGHMQVLNNALKVSEEENLIPAVLLFDCHTKEILAKQSLEYLLTKDDRDEMLRQKGFVLITAYFEKIRNMSPLDFIKCIHDELNVEVVCSGFNFHYGSKGLGDADSLVSNSKQCNMKAIIGIPVLFERLPISSTRIRNLLHDGDVVSVNKMLGRYFSYCFEVVEGDKRGRTMSFPTINQFFPSNFIKLRYGVYASMVEIEGIEYPAVTNIGVRPTIKTQSLRSETHIIGYTGNLYNKFIRVYLLDYIRGEMDFGSIENLTKQITLDASKAKEIYNGYK